MSRIDSSIMHEEQHTFQDSMHLYETNISFSLHDKTMLKKLNMQLALYSVEKQRQQAFTTYEEEQLDAKVLLCNEKNVMLTYNLWVHARLVNGALGTMISLFYAPDSKPPKYSSFVVVDFKQYKGTPWDISHPTYVPISPITRGAR